MYILFELKTKSCLNLYWHLWTELYLSNIQNIKTAEIGKILNTIIYNLYGKTQASKLPKVQSHTLDNSVLKLELLTEGRDRAHEVLIRLRKQLMLELGSKYKVGIRDIVITKYEITFNLAKPALHTFTIPFVDRLSIDGKTCSMLITNVTEKFLQDHYVDRLIRLVTEKVEAQYYEGKTEHWKLIWQSSPKQCIWNKDPSIEMLTRNWIKQGPTKGKWAYLPQPTNLIRTMEKIAVENVLNECGFEEVIIPHHEALDILLKTGHLHGVPNECYYISEPRTRSPEAWEDYKDLVKVTREPQSEKLANMISEPVACVSYAQCPNVYWTFEGKTIAEDSLPILVFDRAQISNRYEAGGRHGIERTDEFHRIEPVYIGTHEQIMELRDKMIRAYSHVFNDLLELEWRMAQVKPFYMAHSGEVDFDVQDNEKGTIDFEAYLPYRGERSTSEWLEFQNFSIVGDKYTKAFNIKGQKEELWSGCSGIGLERWTAAFLAQKGLDPDKWPDNFRKYIRGFPKEIRFV